MTQPIYNLSRAEFNALPIAYRGIEPSRRDGDIIHVTPDINTAKSHGKYTMTGRVVPNELLPDPEVEGFEARDLTGIESFNLGSARIPREYYFPDNYGVYLSLAESGFDEPASDPQIRYIEQLLARLGRSETVSDFIPRSRGYMTKGEAGVRIRELEEEEKYKRKLKRGNPGVPLLPTTATGTCYPDAWRYVMQHPEAVLAHGTAISLGSRIGHAWVELPNGTVWEPSSQAVMPIERFYALVDPMIEDRYTSEEAAIMLARVSKHGPWSAEERMEHIGG